jgi:myosin-crossreactive antigen
LFVYAHQIDGSSTNCIIIGSGMAGLTAAAYLVRDGHDRGARRVSAGLGVTRQGSPETFDGSRPISVSYVAPVWRWSSSAAVCGDDATS